MNNHHFITVITSLAQEIELLKFQKEELMRRCNTQEDSIKSLQTLLNAYVAEERTNE